MKKLNRKKSILKALVNDTPGKLILAVCLLTGLQLLSVYGQDKSTTGAVPPITVKVQQLVDGLEAPTALAFPGNGDVWVLEQKGKIRVIKNGKLTDDPLLDLHDKLIKVNNSYEERGLLSIALHPKFSVNRKFYVFYSAPSSNKSDHKDVIAEYKLSANSDKIDPN
ncbi:MAG: PQQ-dependent sugar dehydrogenase, partial [Mucilaginibacter sp.]